MLACGPALVLNGGVSIYPEYEGFHDPHVMGITRRMGAGVTADGGLLLVTTLKPVSFHRWAAVMKALKCVGAMNLDAGASLAMYYHGRLLERPGRNLTNLLVVTESPATIPTASTH